MEIETVSDDFLQSELQAWERVQEQFKQEGDSSSDHYRKCSELAEKAEAKLESRQQSK